MKQLNELIDTKESGWILIKSWLETAKNQFEVLPNNINRAESELLSNQVTTCSTMGAMIYETGGLIIDHGWLRVLGSGSKKLDLGIHEWNIGKTIIQQHKQPHYLLIADDILGGYFSINGGSLGENLGDIYYLAPDCLRWENLEIGYSDFLNWCLNGDLDQFYGSLRWNNWKTDVQELTGNQVFSFYPFLWTIEGKNIDELSKKAISIEENFWLLDTIINEIKNLD
ncbi:DUF2625 domain-containing protein [Acinetobacter beijerinckii]|uniref:DUF2625 domain-containing protein n=1 Tax=Acinetobacter beijerinckii TaxID=262668 RepID=UPI003AF4BE2C